MAGGGSAPEARHSRTRLAEEGGASHEANSILGAGTMAHKLSPALAPSSGRLPILSYSRGCFGSVGSDVRWRGAVDSEYDTWMGVATGIVVAGRVVVEGLDLPEGSTVTILTPEPEGEVYLSSEEEEELLEAMAEADRGETISAEELFARLDRIATL
jgi:hypothetical protein